MSKLCLVTGVGPGTGTATVRRFSESGYKVAMLSRSEERLSSLEAEIPNTKAYPCDVSNEEQMVTRNLIPLSEAREKKSHQNWKNYSPPEPELKGIRIFDNYALDELTNYFDWTPFFTAWELKGKYPKIFGNKKVGRQAKILHDDALKLLNRIVSQNLLIAKGVIGFFPAVSIGDDIRIFRDEGRQQERMVLHHLRQQISKSHGQPNRCLSDYIAPEESGLKDWIGAFVVTVGHGVETLSKRFEKDGDDYKANGTLTIKGITKEVSFTLKMEGEDC